MDFEKWIELGVKKKASDLHLCSAHYPRLRIDGELQVLEGYSRVDEKEIKMLSQTLLTEPKYLQLAEKGQLDFAFTQNKQRLRGHFFKQQYGISAAFRFIPESCPDFDVLNIPAIVQQLMRQENGLILITGATGSGKSTTLNAVISAMNQRYARHIIILEDPIEYLHRDGLGLIQQRDLSLHTCSANAALSATLRQDPDIILLSELRDLESIRLALTAAETGHLVLATLHTRTAAQAVDRLIDVFPAEDKSCVRGQLASSLIAVLAQKLVLKEGGGRIPLFEVLVRTPAVSHLIREGKIHQLEDVMHRGSQWGMQTFTQHKEQLQQEGSLAKNA
ncbi:type IV pili twitching motility protein PilT [Candidatus Williamhamiltonella defendens]|uniref:PilT-like ATPase type IV pilus biogenesis protein n=2 Tax=Candidatus Williamhamiltonella defendens TaxID=138072 RepID=C4K3U2_HAMD5|nr:PilT/PilU family type 4a pilus ATPase [Candidatus Hamiltonella defensa]ACQ67235.1 PilT-like ATPase type IV pilus biogenesis protein [Candidatus Hamiltonella defensa 5AT (Acyrthosiphon pisum)]ATW21990.1 type IV pili twitching motility protein PilT [Candidatus Hamiltonella defensa]ATW29244.1 type IV pili twitching motility protein PilT [Candidatus Hamiltonella defensa]ATW31226.1 type IV pili twitching motility protein PilT [Candidatus Hamiltonella defensa]